jgi:hypothetical protein
MFRVSAPALQSYLNQFRSLRRDTRRDNMDASNAAFRTNQHVTELMTPSQEKYDAWFKEVYGVEANSDEAISATPSNLALDDTKAMMHADSYDETFLQTEANFWAKEHSAAELRKRGYD